MEKQNVFADLNKIDIQDKIKKKLNISYLPWSSAWEFIKKYDPTAFYVVSRTNDGTPYFTDGKTCWVETTLTIKGESYSEMLAVMDHKNAAVPIENVTMVQVNKSIKRCLVKNAALFGLGLSLWNGEELSDAAKEERDKERAEKAAIENEKAALRSKLLDLCNKKISDGLDKEILYTIVKKYNRNPEDKNINNLPTAEAIQKCYDEINALGGN